MRVLARYNLCRLEPLSIQHLQIAVRQRNRGSVSGISGAILQGKQNVGKVNTKTRCHDDAGAGDDGAVIMVNLVYGLRVIEQQGAFPIPNTICVV